MDIAVIGAGGDVGKAVCLLIVSERLLDREERLVLVGNPEGASGRSLYGFAVDLMDGFAENCPKIEVVLKPDELNADLVIMTAGATIPISDGEVHIERDFLARQNRPIFEFYAASLAKGGKGTEIVLCVSNPNELAVDIFSKHLGRKRVIGMGAFLDSLRFRREIARDLGVRRQWIHGFMVGEHGFNMVPLWSSIHVYGLTNEELQNAFIEIRQGYRTCNFTEDVEKARDRIQRFITDGKVREAYDIIDKYPPDIRVAMVPFVTHFSGAKTVVGTAKSVMELVRMVTLGSDTLISGQVSLEGEFHGIHGTIGVPFVIGNKGVDRIIEIQIDEDEKELLVQCAYEVAQKIENKQ